VNGTPLNPVFERLTTGRQATRCVFTCSTGVVMDAIPTIVARREPWNKGKLIGQKAPLKLKEIWAIRVRLQLGERRRELALFNLALDSKLRACDLVNLRVRDVCHGSTVASRTIVMQQKTQRPVQFEITEPTRDAVAAWIAFAGLRPEDHLFPSRIHDSRHLSTRQYARIVGSWVRSDRAGSIKLWHTLDASHEGNADLSADEESARRPVTARTHQAGKHGAIPRHRGR
jgi:integrase